MLLAIGRFNGLKSRLVLGMLAGLLCDALSPATLSAAATEPVQAGFVFIDGRFVPGPYEIEESPQGAKINGHEVSFAKRGSRSDENYGTRFTSTNSSYRVPGARMQGFGPSQGSPQGPPQGWRPGGPSRRDRESRAEMDWEILRLQLANNALLIAFANTPALILQQREAECCLKVLADRDPAGVAQAELLEKLPTTANRDAVVKWLNEFQPTEAFLTPALALVSNLEKLEAANYATIDANIRLQTFAYPLTMFGMVMSVLSLGHLLQSAPRPRHEPINEAWQNDLIRATVYSLGLVIVLSGLDLVWTLLASQAGQMTEVNPIGNQLIGSASMLSLFKISVTLGSCGLLYFLRRHPRAQWASWWACLVCTVLTFRWLVLNSMFIT